MDDTLIVLPSSRAIRQRELDAKESVLLPDYITMSEFVTKLAVVKGFSFLDEEMRVLLLLEASDFKNFSALQIERNFFTFTKNSSYIFKFFEELSAEMYDIKGLQRADLYAEYEEHIAILQELYFRYEQLCYEKKVFDRVFLPKLYSFNSGFVKQYRKIEISLEGYLTNFELHLLLEATAYCDVVILFHTTRFNKKMQRKFFELGFLLEEGFSYSLLLNSKKILKKEPIRSSTTFSCVSFSEPILQIAYIKERVYAFVQKGYSPQKIAVILPDESKAEIIRSFDKELNFNFAMGSSFSKTTLYQQLYGAIQLLKNSTYENIYRVDRNGDAIYKLLYPIYRKSIKELDFEAVMQKIMAQSQDAQEKKIFKEELYLFLKILPHIKEISVENGLNLFMRRLKGRTIDDVGGGKITVMGLLESRSVVFDAVVIIDFDEKSLIKRSQKDMFLNKGLREMAGLPTSQDRENLQKHYYQMVMLRAKEVAISSVASQELSPSLFLKELSLNIESAKNEREYASILFKRSLGKTKRTKEIIRAYSFKDIELSASRLKTFLQCKRAYYYHYIEQIKEHEIPRDMPQEYVVGNIVHKALENLYRERDFYEDIKELESNLYHELDSVGQKSELEAYLIAIKKRELRAFCENEIRRFQSGWRVKHVEKGDLKSFYGGIKIGGKIDRIDMRAGVVALLDYKTGNYELYNEKNVDSATDFQLEFYYLLACQLGSVEESAFYDLKEGKIVQESLLEEKLLLLERHIEHLLSLKEINFELCEDTKRCQFCPYKIMCGRG